MVSEDELLELLLELLSVVVELELLLVLDSFSPLMAAFRDRYCASTFS